MDYILASPIARLAPSIPAPAARAEQHQAANSAAAGNADAAATRARIERTARDFEAMTLQHLLAPLFQSVETPAIAGGGKHEEAFGAMLQEEYAKTIAASGGVGIADRLIEAMLALQTEIPVVETP